jgi:predicted lipid-binding transport protein (Tim44 family)
MFRLRWLRFSAVFAALVAVLSLGAVDTAQARFGGSFGSRGARTTFSLPKTPTSPNITTPVQRTTTQGIGRATAAGAVNRGWFGNGLGGWLLGGLLFSGLFGMMFGAGFGGFGGIFSLLIQLLVIGFIVRWLFRRFGQRPATAGGYGNAAPYSAHDYAPRGGSGHGASAARSNASRRAGKRDEIGISDADLSVFEQRLGQLQDLYSREDVEGLRRIATPEMVGYLAEELARSAAKGLRNEVFDVKLLDGDIVEAWREGSDRYASVALHYESRDVMRDRATGALTSGEDRVLEHREVWTFISRNGGAWMLSAIQS